MSTTSADPCDQVVEGTDDGDVMNGGKGDDTFDGGDGDDILNGGAGSDTLSGGEGDDQLNGGSGDDVLTGGDGDDVLNGGGGSDVYKFYFTLSAGSTVTYTYPDGPTYDDPTPTSEPTGTTFGSGTDYSNFGQLNSAWDNYTDDVNAWYDANQGSTIDTDQTDETVNLDGPGSADLSYSYDDTITIAGGDPEITAADGDDTITQFQNSGPNVDTIELCGITQEQAALLFTYQTGDFDNDGYADDARISWEGATDDTDGSITIVGTTWADLDAFLNDPYVVFS